MTPPGRANLKLYMIKTSSKEGVIIPDVRRGTKFQKGSMYYARQNNRNIPGRPGTKSSHQ